MSSLCCTFPAAALTEVFVNEAEEPQFPLGNVHAFFTFSTYFVYFVLYYLMLHNLFLALIAWLLQ